MIPARVERETRFFFPAAAVGAIVFDLEGFFHFVDIDRRSNRRMSLLWFSSYFSSFDKNCTTLEQSHPFPRVLLMNMSFASMSNLVSCFLTSLIDDEWKATSCRTVAYHTCRWKEVTSHWTDTIPWKTRAWCLDLLSIFYWNDWLRKHERKAIPSRGLRTSGVGIRGKNDANKRRKMKDQV